MMAAMAGEEVFEGHHMELSRWLEQHCLPLTHLCILVMKRSRTLWGSQVRKTFLVLHVS